MSDNHKPHNHTDQYEWIFCCTAELTRETEEGVGKPQNGKLKIEQSKKSERDKQQL